MTTPSEMQPQDYQAQHRKPDYVPSHGAVGSEPYTLPAVEFRDLVQPGDHNIDINDFDAQKGYWDGHAAGVQVGHLLISSYLQDDPAAHVSIAYEHLRSLKARDLITADEAMRDQVTGAYTRKIIEPTYHGLQNSRHNRQYGENTDAPNSFIMLDIDHFKAVNDEYGHNIGDEVLVHLTKLLQDNVRERDVVVRLGGEEFGLILPRASGADAVNIAEKLRQKIAITPVTVSDGSNLAISASFGVTELDLSRSWTDNYTAADLALYQAKQSGRNRVDVYDPRDYEVTDEQRQRLLSRMKELDVEMEAERGSEDLE